MGVTAAVIGAGVMLGSTAYQIKTSNDAKHKADDQATAQKNQQDQLIADQQKKQTVADATDLQAAQRANMLRGAASQGYSGTILGGASSSAPSSTSGGGTKTLLGM